MRGRARGTFHNAIDKEQSHARLHPCRDMDLRGRGAITTTEVPAVGPDSPDGLELLGLLWRGRLGSRRAGQRRLHGRRTSSLTAGTSSRSTSSGMSRWRTRPSIAAAPSWRWTPTGACSRRPTGFPMTKETRSFKPMADYLHARGLKFGLHLLRGIPRQAVRQNVPILGTTVRAADIADQNVHLQMERRHVRRGHGQTRGAGVLRFGVRPDCVVGSGFREGR